ncbi:MAG: GGDEF domain-containing protein [Burkholderiaceae bacterium]|nr:GGDEF domain-containing protein [Burkholderiaceae bacterium]
MLHTDEGPNIKARANRLVDQVFATQLEILQSFLPLKGWLLGYDSGGHFSVVASTGGFVGTSQAVLTAMTDGLWSLQTECAAVCHRMVDLDKLHSLDLMGGCPALMGTSSSPGNVHLVRMTLNSLDSTNQAYLFGLSDSCPCTTLNSVKDQVMQCLDAMGLIVALCTELTALSQRATEIQRDAFIDPLTMVMNRSGWNHSLLELETLEATTATGAAIIMLDLDLLKEVNDSQGHSAGDDLLCLTAHTITSVLRSGDIVARLGGDEFGIIVKSATPDSAILLMQRLKVAFDKVKIGISMGAAMQSEAGNSLQVTVQMADKRMYADKRTKPASGKHYLDWMLGRANHPLNT